jgi:hypothetical protein
VSETVDSPARLRVRGDKAARGEQDHTPDEFRPVGCQTAGDAIAKRMAHDVRRGRRKRLDHPGNIGGEVVEGEAVQGAGACAHAAKIDRHRAKPRHGEVLREGGQIANVVAPGRKQDHGVASASDDRF